MLVVVVARLGERVGCVVLGVLVGAELPVVLVVEVEPTEPQTQVGVQEAVLLVKAATAAPALSFSNTPTRSRQHSLLA